MASGIPKPMATAHAHVRNGSTNAPAMSAAAMSAHIHTHQRAHSDGRSLPHTIRIPEVRIQGIEVCFPFLHERTLDNRADRLGPPGEHLCQRCGDAIVDEILLRHYFLLMYTTT